VQVITTHVNADFDALASMIGARKLYPGAVLVFPGATERGLRDFILKSAGYLFGFQRAKNIDLEQVSRLILVDTKQRGRIGRFAEIADRPGVEIHVYDHHPPSADDLTAIHEVSRPVGATTTILVQLVREQGLTLTPEEATVMALGIYEDTGSLLFESTTPEDYHAAAWLLEQGADLNVVHEIIAKDLTSEQIALLNEIIQATTVYNIGGIDIALTWASLETYVGDFAVLVHKLMELENFKVLFALARMEDRTHIVARSRLAEVNAGEIMAAFGGGGHPTAASASVHNLTLIQVEEKLLTLLRSTLPGRARARELMSSPVKAVGAGCTVAHAAELIVRYNVNVLPVMEDDCEQVAGGRLVGLISRQVLEKAMFHHLGERLVSDFMSTEFQTISAEGTLLDIQNIIIEGKQRLLPVVEEGSFKGVITRTDLLNKLIDESLRGQPLYKERARQKSIANVLNERLPEEVVGLLRQVGEVAEELGYTAYAVGGFIRDLLLKRANLDIDVVIEGDGIKFARTLAARMHARARYHREFGTALVIFPDGFKIDVATARLEYYEYPAALPTVEISSLKLDLYRRDFTVNTLAVKLNPAEFGILLDFFNAQRDLKEGRLRVLHNLSFIEDPTRIFRALRFEQRFGFKLGKQTTNLIKSAIRVNPFANLSRRRVFIEVKLILQEDDPLAILRRLSDFGLLAAIHPKIGLGGTKEALFEEAGKVIAWHGLLFLEEPYERWLVYFLVLIDELSSEEARELFGELFWLGPRRGPQLASERLAAQRAARTLEAPTLLPSEIYKLLSGLSTEVLLWLMAKTHAERGRRAVSLYFTELKKVRIELTGEDLINMGLKPGPVFQEVLGSLFEARLNGLVKTREDEIEFVRHHYLRAC
jgi:tRNA nucleotidyltransferase (CCA-adding enzyme)